MKCNILHFLLLLLLKAIFTLYHTLSKPQCYKLHLQSLVDSPAELQAEDTGEEEGEGNQKGSSQDPLATKMCFRPGVILATRQEADA